MRLALTRPCTLKKHSVLRSKNLSAEEARSIAPFPTWELKLFLIQFVGLAEAVGVAISSECQPYEIGGALTLIFMLLTYGFMIYLMLLSFVFSKQVRSKYLFCCKRDTVSDGNTDRFCLLWRIFAD